ncbi:hypothetical protein ARMGADRAFT_612151 [Armillaria gallica]|uniref:Uncharacterized protein n=1 Tax=Armillaria gallica TaxID=47427 RepID=A0A2H3CM50_ARMGA|nr:hypothetical protein ARMGADRAFT_612151 [Armillaria gallica]
MKLFSSPTPTPLDLSSNLLRLIYVTLLCRTHPSPQRFMLCLAVPAATTALLSRTSLNDDFVMKHSPATSLATSIWCTILNCILERIYHNITSTWTSLPLEERCPSFAAIFRSTLTTYTPGAYSCACTAFK